MRGRSGRGQSLYRLCPLCGRAVPLRSAERFCVNDGARLLEACPACGAGIASPYARFCAGCGASLVPERPRKLLAPAWEARREP